ncbi:MAG TPA: hypothetical protein VM366_01990 [Anaerolineae bacterium]|nr:hypothetical protein [Anaerolineae bacterium]
MRTRILLPFACLLLLFAGTACGLGSPIATTPTATRPPEAVPPTSTPTATLLPGPQDVPTTQVEPPSTPTGQAELSSTPTPQPSAQPTTAAGPASPFSQLQLSPPFDVYVGLIQQGFCGPMTNSGWFESLSFDTVFHDVRFTPPSEQLFWPNGAFVSTEIVIPLMNTLGEGSIDAFTLCPMYDPGARPCSVTRGPLPFEPVLEIVQDPDAAFPVVPLMPGTPVPEPGSVVLLLFSIGSTTELGTILEWQSHVGSGALGGSLQPMQFPFEVPWDKIMAGEDLTIEVPYEEEGERMQWTLRLIPQGSQG